MKKQTKKVKHVRIELSPSEAEVVESRMMEKSDGIPVSLRSFCKWAILRFCEGK